MLNDYILQCGIQTMVVRNDYEALKPIPIDSCKGIVFSPGPNRPSQAGAMMSLIEAYYNQLPMLGVCLGHQAIGEFFGATLLNASYPMHGKTSPIVHYGHPLFNHIPNPFEAMRYHSLLLENIKQPLVPIAHTHQGELMAIAHQTLPIAGVQFHPESILTPSGLQIIKNWLYWTKILEKP